MADPLAKIILRKARQIFVWPVEAALVFLLYFIARLMPVAMASVVIGGFMRLLGPLTPWDRRARRNLAAAMPELDIARQRTVLNAMWWNIGRVVGEYPHVARLASKGHVEFVGREHLEGLKSGGFLVGAHIGNWELGPYAAITAGQTVAAIYRPLNNPLLSGLLERRQAAYGGDIYRKGREAALGMVTALKKGQFMCLLVDQQLREGMVVPFFGLPSTTSISYIKLAIRKKVPVCYMRTERLGGCRFRVTISPPIDLPKTDDEAAILATATKINATLEDWIRAKPEQWFWPHRRWGKNI
ncbi:MAG: lauroyl acyltransferase [Alphaproteobacteria bacterium]